MAKGLWRSRSPKYNFQGLINALTWSNGFCGERGKRGGMVGKGKGPWQRNVVIIYIILMMFFFMKGFIYSSSH